MRQSDDISQRRSLVAGEIRPIAGAQATSVAQRCADKRPALALLITAALSSAAIAAPSFEVTIFDLPNLNNNSGTGDRLRIDMSGNVAPVTLPSIAGFYTADRNASGLLAGTCNTSGTGAGNAACLYDTAASALSTFGGGTSGAYNVNEAGDVLWGPEDPRTGNQTTELHIRTAGGADLPLGFTSYWRPSFNNKHDVVGRLYGGAAFYVYDDVKLDLEPLVVDLKGLRELAPTDVNDAGMIAGWAFFGQNEVRAFALIPIDDTPAPTVPEPTTWALAGLGLLATAFSRRRR